ncbi:ABC transporter substrate-binding protein [Paenibacillus aurantiacus]|uniref:ABC transporter substrate-binding protein n=1 Tax=Paenibacillus aurantiacus TaxID=1936118 RepID=A0ABV5KRQ4_9BACL
MKFSKGVLTSLIVISAILVQGCSDNDSFNPEEPGKLKVMYQDEDTFNQRYGNLISSKFPNLEIEIVGTQQLYTLDVNTEEDYKVLIEKEEPDVILMNTLNQYSELAEKNKLLDLEQMLLEEDFKSADLLPGSLQLLREKGGTTLYGISPYFCANALYYNRDLFDKYKVPLPTKSLTWPEVIELAKRFPTAGSEEERIYGFTMNTYLSDLGLTIGETSGLQTTDSVGKKVTVRTDGWKQVYGMVADAQKSGAFYFPGNLDYSKLSYEESLKADKFISGKAAMTLKEFYYADYMKHVATSGKIKPVKWGWLREPVDPANPDVSSSFYLNEIYGVNANSANKEAAWQLVKLINGDEAARLLSRSNNSGCLMTRTIYNKPDEGVNYDPFYSLQPRGQSMLYKLGSFYRSFRPLMNKELEAVVSGSKNMDEALATLQNEGQLELDMLNKRLAKGR